MNQYFFLIKLKLFSKKKPGIFFIYGKNGSGKSTLLDTIIGLNNNLFNWNYQAILNQQIYFKNNIRIIDKNPPIFHNIENIDEQIIGSLGFQKKWLEKVRENTFNCLSPGLAKWWAVKFELFHKTISDRWSKPFANKELSSGEMVILSIARLWSNWDPDVKLILIDESETPLDQETKENFFDMLQELSLKCTIYFVSHDKNIKLKFMMKKLL